MDEGPGPGPNRKGKAWGIFGPIYRNSDTAFCSYHRLLSSPIEQRWVRWLLVASMALAEWGSDGCWRVLARCFCWRSHGHCLSLSLCSESYSLAYLFLHATWCSSVWGIACIISDLAFAYDPLWTLLSFSLFLSIIIIINITFIMVKHNVFSISLLLLLPFPLLDITI